MAQSSSYRPNPIDTSGVELPKALEDLSELLAENAHEIWAQERMSQGWHFGQDRQHKEHPDLIPYRDLDESEKALDRKASMGTLKAIIKLGFRIQPATES